jgi:PAP2 superfamily protein
MNKILPFYIVCILLVSCYAKQDYKKFTSDPVLFCKTVKKLNDVVLQNNFPPMIASRNYVYANIAAYECVVQGDDRFQSLSGQIKHMPAMPKADKSKEIDYHLAALFAFSKVGNAVTFPEGSMMGYYDELKNEAKRKGISSTTLKNTIAFSDTIAATILKWSRKDNYVETRSAEKFTVEQVDGRWIPTPPMYAQAVEPHWKEIRCMVLDSCSQCKPPRPPLYDLKNKNGQYYKALMEVKTIGDSLTDEEKAIADFWDDNPFKMNVVGHAMYATKKFSPPGHWMNIVGIAAKEANADFATTVAAYTETSIALFDGFIACWDEKFRSNYVRPETVINKYFTADWSPYIQTPPFPSYVSGHATISAAAAEVMTSWFGDHLGFTDTSSLEFGIKSRRIVSFRDAAKEAAMSRLYGGIHYRFDNDEGNKIGIHVGELILQRLKFKK